MHATATTTVKAVKKKSRIVNSRGICVPCGKQFRTNTYMKNKTSERKKNKARRIDKTTKWNLIMCNHKVLITHWFVCFFSFSLSPILSAFTGARLQFPFGSTDCHTEHFHFATKKKTDLFAADDCCLCEYVYICGVWVLLCLCSLCLVVGSVW